MNKTLPSMGIRLIRQAHRQLFDWITDSNTSCKLWKCNENQSENARINCKKYLQKIKLPMLERVYNPERIALNLAKTAGFEPESENHLNFRI